MSRSMEEAALIAVIDEDHQEARRIVDEMLPGERAALAGQLDTLRLMLTDEYGNIRTDVPEEFRTRT